MLKLSDILSEIKNRLVRVEAMELKNDELLLITFDREMEAKTLDMFRGIIGEELRAHGFKGAVLVMDSTVKVEQVRSIPADSKLMFHSCGATVSISDLYCNQCGGRI